MLDRRALLSRAAMFAFFGASLEAQSRQVIEITERRPLAAALDPIEAAIGRAVSYEDVPYEHEADLEAVSDPRIRKFINGRPARVPRERTIRIELGPVESDAERRHCLDVALASYRRNRLPGDFRIEETRGSYYLIASQTTGADGKVRAVHSPLLEAITLPYAKRSVIDTVALITTEASRLSGRRIFLGTVPLAQATVGFGTDQTSARDSLERLFREAGSTVSYRLLFDPLVDGYMLNLHNAFPR